MSFSWFQHRLQFGKDNAILHTKGRITQMRTTSVIGTRASVIIDCTLTFQPRVRFGSKVPCDITNDRVIKDIYLRLSRMKSSLSVDVSRVIEREY